MRALERSGARAFPVKTRAALDESDALVIPGGESTTVIRLLERFEMDEPIVARVRAGMPLWGTCMGMIVAAREVAGLEQRTLGLLDIAVRRNAFGRQIASEEIDLEIAALGEPAFPAIFIRAPWIESAGPGVEVLASRTDLDGAHPLDDHAPRRVARPRPLFPLRHALPVDHEIAGRPQAHRRRRGGERRPCLGQGLAGAAESLDLRLVDPRLGQLRAQLEDPRFVALRPPEPLLGLPLAPRRVVEVYPPARSELLRMRRLQ